MWDWTYLTWAAGIAAAIGTVIALPGERFSKPIKETVATWLMAGSNTEWASQFNALFDHVMGAHHFSLRRFVSSAIATALAVGALYILMEPVLGLLSGRTDKQISWWEIVTFAVAINLVADYLSLIETRWLLGRFEKYQNWFVQLGLLVVDLAISASLIWGAITAFRWVQGDDILMPLEMIAGYTEFSIFFYSTFLTSIWAWAFYLSAWTIRLFAGLRLYKVFDVAEKPFANLGFVAGIVVFASLVVAKPVTEAALPEDMDHWLCLNFEGKICTHAARISTDDALKFEQLKRACTTGDPAQCQMILAGFEEQMVAEAVPFLEAACWDGDNGGACNTLGYMNDEAIGLPQDYTAAKLFYERGCDFKNWPACNNLGVLYQKGLGVAQDYDKARDLYQTACDNQDWPACSNLGFLYHKGLGLAQDYAKARELYQTACDNQFWAACDNLGVLHYSGLGVPVDKAKAIDLFDRACKGGDQVACDNLAIARGN